ncbi:hypothetical protein BCO18175_03281 [Burkholderia contaminans]|nr:hypothetical protein BCO18175_03281 [Burkholderia contaminans]VWD41879.1 hypothetical protein BCO18442_05419 [Burkholderia contaminans]
MPVMTDVPAVFGICMIASGFSSLRDSFLNLEVVK